jgi:hypothetical protein
LVVVVLLLAVIAGGGWFAWHREPDHPLGRRNYRQIVTGMSRDDVAQILGGPPGPQGQAPQQPAFVQLVEQEGPVDALGGLQGKPEVWFNDRGQIVVRFDTWDKTGRVIGKQLYRVVPRP